MNHKNTLGAQLSGDSSLSHPLQVQALAGACSQSAHIVMSAICLPRPLGSVRRRWDSWSPWQYLFSYYKHNITVVIYLSSPVRLR